MRVFVALILLALPSVAFAQQQQQQSISDFTLDLTQRVGQLGTAAANLKNQNEALQKQVQDLQKQLEAARKVPPPPTARATPVPPRPPVPATPIKPAH